MKLQKGQCVQSEYRRGGNEVGRQAPDGTGHCGPWKDVELDL